jgi:CRP-like cAMP-binding protein
MTAVMRKTLASVFDDARPVALAAGDPLFLAGTKVERIFLVRAGEVQLRRHSQHGAAMILQRAGPGAVVAEASAYSPRYHCDAVAVGPAVVSALPKPAFRAALRGDPALAEAWAEALTLRVQAARLRAEIRSLPRVAERLDAWLAEGGALPARGRWQEVAAELGVTREALYRELARRRPAGVSP